MKDCGLPNLLAEVAFWQKAFGLDDWTIMARHVEDPRANCFSGPDRRDRMFKPGDSLLGMVRACSLENRTAEIRIRTPRTDRALRKWPVIVCHEMLHVVCAAHRGAGWTLASEHNVINTAAPLLAQLKKKDPAAARSAAAVTARVLRGVWPRASHGAPSCNPAREPSQDEPRRPDGP